MSAACSPLVARSSPGSRLFTVTSVTAPADAVSTWAPILPARPIVCGIHPLASTSWRDQRSARPTRTSSRSSKTLLRGSLSATSPTRRTAPSPSTSASKSLPRLSSRFQNQVACRFKRCPLKKLLPGLLLLRLFLLLSPNLMVHNRRLTPRSPQEVLPGPTSASHQESSGRPATSPSTRLEANKRARELAAPSPSPASASVPSVSAEGERSSEGVKPQVASQAHSVVFTHLRVQELNTKLKEEFNELTDDADLDKLISDPSLEPSVCVYTAVADPTTRRQALASPNAEQWQKAMQEEIATITRKRTFSLAALPSGRIALPVKSASGCSRPSSMLKAPSLASRLVSWLKASRRSPVKTTMRPSRPSPSTGP